MSGGKVFMKNSDNAAVQNKMKQQKERLIDDALKMKAPRSFIITQGSIFSKVKHLVSDMRKVMEPYTAAKLEERKKNSLKDFLSMASFFHVTHLMTISESTLDTPYLKICRMPHGPTLNFKIHSFSLMKDISKMYRKSVSTETAFEHSPLVMMNGFPSNEPHTQLMTTMFQNMFPTISVKTLKLSECKRVVMFNYNKETKLVQMRHYVIIVGNSGVNRAVRKVAKQAKAVNMRKFANAADFVLKEGAGAVSSDSEMDETLVAVRAPQKLSKNIQENSTVNVRLREIGPRMDLELVKVEDGFFEGNVIYHAYSARTPQEEAALALRKKQEKSLKDRRRAEQEANVERKTKEKDDQKAQRLAKREARSQQQQQQQQDGDDDDNENNKSEEEEGGYESPTFELKGGEEDEAEYYRQEVGEEPDEDFMKYVAGTKKSNEEKAAARALAQTTKAQATKGDKQTTKGQTTKGQPTKNKNTKGDTTSPFSKKTKRTTDDGPKKKKMRR